MTEVRVLRCRADKAGDFTSFLASVYFPVNGDWYYLELIGSNPLPVVGNPKGYAGPGVYSATADFRKLKAYGGGKVISSDRAWGVPIDKEATLTVSAGEQSITIGGANSSYLPRPVLSSSLDLWPKSQDSSGPVPEPTPLPEQIEHVGGSWQCR